MPDSKYFNFVNFKSVMDVTDADEATFAFLLRTVFKYIKQKYTIDLDATLTTTLGVGSTVSALVVPYSTEYLIDQLVTDGTEETYITAVSNDDELTLSTLTVSPSFTLLPTDITISTTLIPFDLQYAIYQHIRFLFESQKRNTNIIDSITDATGNKVSYKAKVPEFISSVYVEYSPNAVAFS